MPFIKALVDKETKNRFRSLSKAKGVAEADFLREIIDIVLDNDKTESNQQEPVSEVESEQGWATVRIPKAVLNKANIQAENKGMAKSRWIAALVNTHLGNTPVMTETETIALQQSNRELAAIGRNINQIARSLNEAFFETERVKIALLNELKNTITANREVIRNLVRSSRKSWGVQDEPD